MQAHYFTDIDTRHIEGANRMVLAPFAGYSARYDITWCVVRRFVGDESSVPRFPVIYTLFGGRGNWECWPHDMGYRWRLGLGRVQWDLIFHEMAEARQRKMSKQSLWRRPWRFFIRNAMTAGVLVGGWVAYKNYPGCLDYRQAKKKRCEPGPADCMLCQHYYPYWKDCVWEGYRPEIVEFHKRLEAKR